VRRLPVISHTLDIASIGAAKMAERIEVGEEERKALAAALGLVDVSALSAEVRLKRDRNRVIHVDGRLTAEVVQECVVSLEPVRQTIDEPINLRFVEGGLDAKSGSSAVDIEPTGDDPPEIVHGPTIDLGQFVVEHFILAVDPFPRAPGAELPANPLGEAEDSADSPFSVLGALVRRPAKDG
jgi:uncharacterized metal-binding protein YceD (DUF177 family)